MSSQFTLSPHGHAAGTTITTLESCRHRMHANSCTVGSEPTRDLSTTSSDLVPGTLPWATDLTLGLSHRLRILLQQGSSTLSPS